MQPIRFKACNTNLAEYQPQYIPLPCHLDAQGVMTTLWKLNWWDRLAALFTGRLFLQQLTFKHPPQPQRPSFFNPLESHVTTQVELPDVLKENAKLRALIHGVHPEVDCPFCTETPCMDCMVRARLFGKLTSQMAKL